MTAGHAPTGLGARAVFAGLCRITVDCQLANRWTRPMDFQELRYFMSRHTNSLLCISATKNICRNSERRRSLAT